MNYTIFQLVNILKIIKLYKIKHYNILLITDDTEMG